MRQIANSFLLFQEARRRQGGGNKKSATVEIKMEGAAMTNTPEHEFYVDEVSDDAVESCAFDLINESQVTDDSGLTVNLNKKIEQIFDTITRIGGEVCKLRSEMDGLIEQNSMLVDSFRKLRDVLDAKGYLDIDDFQLACDVFDESQNKTITSQFFRKISH